MREIEDCDYKAQEIKHLQFQLNLAKQELDNALAELAAHKAMVQKMKCCDNCNELPCDTGAGISTAVQILQCQENNFCLWQLTGTK